MNTVRIAAIGDLHLGRRSAPGVQWVRDSLSEAVHRGADVVVFTGDLLDKKKATRLDLHDGVTLYKYVTETLNRPVVSIWGNHDVGSGFIDEFPEIPGVYHPIGASIAKIQIPGIPAVFHAANVITDPDPRDVVKYFPVAQGPGHIGVLHSEVEGLYTKNPCLPTTRQELVAKNYGAWLMGHVHQQIMLEEQPWVGWVGMGNLIELEIAALPN